MTKLAAITSRRGFLSGATCLALAFTATPLVLARRTAKPRPVVGFHMDRPYVDTTGEAAPFSPARGARSAFRLGALNDEQYRWLNPFS